MGGISTFIVRVCPPGAGGLPEPIGTVEHVDTQQRYSFRGAGELVALLLGDRGATPEGAQRTDGASGLGYGG
jgi:hypothetical protein